MPTGDDPAIEPYWRDETDWVSIIEFSPRDQEEERLRAAEALGYFFAYAQITDTRMLALLGDPIADAYELLFSFSSQGNRRKFIELVQSNEITETDPDGMHTPVQDEIDDARPVGMVFSDDVIQHATLIAVMLLDMNDSAIVN